MAESVNDIFTPPSLSNEVLDKLSKDVWKENKIFLDPACGDGNLLVEVAKRKLKQGFSPEEILKSLYGVELLEKYHIKCKERLLELCGDNKENRKIVNKNIILGDFLEMKDSDFYDWSGKSNNKSKYDYFFK